MNMRPSSSSSSAMVSQYLPSPTPFNQSVFSGIQSPISPATPGESAQGQQQPPNYFVHSPDRSLSPAASMAPIPPTPPRESVIEHHTLIMQNGDFNVWPSQVMHTW